MKVAKFGGSSVADAGQFKKVREIVEANADRRVVVVSAAGKSATESIKVTDLLIEVEKLRDAGEDYRPVFKHIERRFVGIRDALGLNVAIENDLQKIEKRIENCSHDYLVSRGEFLTAKLMADFLGFQFIDAARFLVFDGHKVNYGESINRLRDFLSVNTQIVVPGFYGVDETGQIHIMARGGGDVSGAVLANLVDADLYENWTDVSGIKMADPRIVDHSRRINELTYDELQELSYMGVSVFQEEAIKPVEQRQIPIAILNTNHPEEDGTLVEKTVHRDQDQLVTGVAGKKDYVIISIKKYQLNKRFDIMAKVFSEIQRFNVPFEYVSSGTDSFSFLVKKDQLAGQLNAILTALKKCDLDSVTLDQDVALVAAVSHELSERPANAGKILDFLNDSQIKVHLVIQEGSDIKVVFGVANKDYEKTIKKIYRNINSKTKKLRMAI
ncbi:aspartate kinase [Lentilactobacillus kisonensis]|uniref:Aspartokinase n=2 Tax=Lentilactobacillus kisonensis TaxID=481722 RepID=H1LFE1_9LACO|nr:aspartate kinase [Lentilactobacillus kisonensis]EHO51766.1 amino acid kinase family protein [Lentilactobacillus kisonensis F0435]KRL22080.1 amino acid kinase family protein [Lentilactobacillus kisonensis DSM 19906 = JCM 15041]